MRRRRNNRGSAILMVVGLLTVMAMLGSALLVVAYLDRQQSRAMAARQPADPVAEGVVSRLVSHMGRDLYISATAGIYGAAEANANGWLRVIDANDLATNRDVPEAFFSPDFYGQIGNPIATVDTDGDGVPEILDPTPYGITSS